MNRRPEIKVSRLAYLFVAIVVLYVLALMIRMHHGMYDHAMHLVCVDRSVCTAYVEIPYDYSRTWAPHNGESPFTWGYGTDIDLWDWVTRGVWRQRVVDIELQYFSTELTRQGLPRPSVHDWRYSELDGRIPPSSIKRVVLTQNGAKIMDGLRK